MFWPDLEDPSFVAVSNIIRKYHRDLRFWLGRVPWLGERSRDAEGLRDRLGLPQRDPAVDINGLPIHLALPLGETAPIGPKFSSRPISPGGRARCRRSG